MLKMNDGDLEEVSPDLEIILTIYIMCNTNSTDERYFLSIEKY